MGAAAEGPKGEGDGRPGEEGNGPGACSGDGVTNKPGCTELAQKFSRGPQKRDLQSGPEQENPRKTRKGQRDLEHGQCTQQEPGD